MKRLMAGTLAVAASLTITAAAHAAPKTFWFNCAGPTPIGTIASDDPTWSDSAPTASVQSGAGCGWLDPSPKGANQPNPLYDAVYGGTYNGEIRKIELTLYGPSSPLGKLTDIGITADGADVYKGSLTPTESAGPVQGISQYTFSIPAGAANVPASTDPKTIAIAVAGTYLDEWTPGWFHGAKEVPANVKFFGFDDLTPEEQQTALCAEDETQCPDDSGAE